MFTMSVNIVLGIVIIPFLIFRLGSQNYALTVLFSSIFAFASMLEMGIGTSMVKLLSENIALKRYGEYNRIFSSGLIAGVCVAVAVISVSGIFARGIMRLCGVEDASIDIAAEAFWVNMIQSCVVGFLMPSCRAALASVHRFDVISFLMTGLRIFQVVLWFFVLKYTDWGLLGWSYSNVFSLVVFVPMVYVAIRRLVPFASVSFRLVSVGSFFSIWNMGWKLSVIRISLFVGTSFNPMILSFFGHISANTFYQPAVKVSDVFSGFLGFIGDQLTPHVSGESSLKHSGKVRQIYISGSRIAFSLMSVCFVFSWFYGDYVIRLWLGSSLGENYKIVYNVFLFLIGGLALNSMGYIHWATLIGMNKLGFLAKFHIFRIAIILGSAVLMLKYTDLGVYAVVIPNFVMRIVSTFLISWYVGTLIDTGLSEQFRLSYAKPILSAALLFLACYVQNSLFAYGGFASFLADIAVSAVLALSLTYLLAFSDEDRKRVNVVLSDITRRFKKIAS